MSVLRRDIRTPKAGHVRVSVALCTVVLAAGLPATGVRADTFPPGGPSMSEEVDQRTERVAPGDPAWPTSIGWKGCPAPRWPAELNQRTGPGAGQRVLVIGDSLTRRARKPLLRQLRRDGWTPTIRCWGGKRLDWALAQVARAKMRDELPPTVVIAIGTNDMRWIDRARTKSRMVELIDRLGSNRTVLWVDTYASGGDRFTRGKEKWFNRQVHRLSKKHDNVHRVVWGSYARNQGVRFADALHYNAAGERTWARRITDALAVRAKEPDAR